MEVRFVYDEDMDVDCLIAKGAGSLNSPGQKTKTYEALLAFTPDVGDREKVREFVRKYIREHDIDAENTARLLQSNWDSVGGVFEKLASEIFGLKISDTITAYLTVTGRYPYDMAQNYFYVPIEKSNANAVAMHELFHFYTWRVFHKELTDNGASEAKYNDIKESLTEILNTDFQDLLGGSQDYGYQGHKEMRAKINKLRKEGKSIGEIVNELKTFL